MYTTSLPSWYLITAHWPLPILGITIQSNLKWNSHIHQKIAAANSTLGLLQRNIRVSSVDTKACALGYKSLVRPNLNTLAQYGHPGNNISSTMLKSSAVRYVCNVYDPTYSVSSLLHDLSWESLEARCTKANLCMFYKMINNLADIPYYQCTTVMSLRNQHNYNLTSILKIINFKGSRDLSDKMLWNKVLVARANGITQCYICGVVP